MASKIDIYDIATYFEKNNLNILTFSDSKFVNRLKELPYSNSVTSNNVLLDSISFDQYGTELLWWVIALYNDILDPLSTGLIDLRIPDLSALENLMLLTVEEMK